MNCLSMGAVPGRPVFYFHGAPGAPEECRPWEREARHMGLWLLSPDRMASAPELQGDDYFQHLAQGVRSQVGSQRIDVVGFSIGAFVALQVCRHLGTQVRRLHLISAAAPLESGHFLPHMAGRTLFRLARSSPGWLDTHTNTQRLLARRAPHLLLRLMFSNAKGDDRALVADPIFRRWITPLLQGCLVDHRPGYLRELRAYVAAWSSTLPTMTVPTQLWHGDRDNWTPPAMADCLRAILPGCDRIHRLPSQSHYSALFHAMPRICADLGHSAPPSASPSRP